MLKSVSSEGAGGSLCGHPSLRTLTGPYWLWALLLLRVVGLGQEREGAGDSEVLGAWPPLLPSCPPPYQHPPCTVAPL